MSTLWFVGVSTGQSLVNQAFPLWMTDLGRDVRLIGRDLPLGAPAAAYRALVAELAADDDAAGAVITSHKVAVLRAARDLIGTLDPLAAECGELNALRRLPERPAGPVHGPETPAGPTHDLAMQSGSAPCPGTAAGSTHNAGTPAGPTHGPNAPAGFAHGPEQPGRLNRRPGTLAGFARDPLSIGRVVDDIWPRGDQVVCLGAGGSAIALGRHLLSRAEPPTRLAFTDRDPAATRHLRDVLTPWAERCRTKLAVHFGPGPWDDLVASGTAGTLVVNATGLGKDRPGSPVSSTVEFPVAAVVWDLNYRGDLAVLRQAGQRADLVPHDGWSLFCHGWAAALGPILELPDEVATARRFAELATPLRR